MIMNYSVTNSFRAWAVLVEALLYYASVVRYDERENSGVFMSIPGSGQTVDEVDLDGNRCIDGCFARHLFETVNSPRNIGETQPAKLEPEPWWYVVISRYRGALANERCRHESLFSCQISVLLTHTHGVTNTPGIPFSGYHPQPL